MKCHESYEFFSWRVARTQPSLDSHLQEDTGLGGKGGEGGGQWGRTKNNFGATPYFLVIAKDQEGREAFSEALSSISSFLIWLLVICKAEKICLY
jgi:hypothetical protein